MLFAHTLPYGRAPRSNSNSINNHQQPPFVPSELHGYLCRHAFRYAYSTATEVAKARAVTVTATSSQITPSDLNHQEHLDATHVAALLRVISFVRRSSHADQGGFGGDIELDVWLADVMTLHQWMLKLLQPYSPYTEVDRVLGELQNFQLTSFGDVQDGGQIMVVLEDTQLKESPSTLSPYPIGLDGTTSDDEHTGSYQSSSASSSASLSEHTDQLHALPLNLWARQIKLWQTTQRFGDEMLQQVEFGAQQLVALQGTSTMRKAAFLSLALVFVAYARAALLFHMQRQRPAIAAYVCNRCKGDGARPVLLLHCYAVLGGAPAVLLLLDELDGVLPTTPNADTMFKVVTLVCLGIHTRVTEETIRCPGGLVDQLAALVLPCVDQLPLFRQRAVASMLSLYWERDCLAVAAVLDAITTNHLSAMTHPDWLPLLGMTALPTLPRPRQRLTMPTMVKAQRPGPLFLADDGDVDVTSLYGETGVGEVCQLLEALRGYYSPVVGRVCGRVDDAMVDALLRLTRGDGQEAFATEGAVYRGHERLALCRPVLDAFATAGYRPSPALRTALDTMMTTHHTSMALDDLHTYLTWCIAVAHRAPTPILETASSRLLHRLMAHPTRPAPPTTSAPCYVAHQARWLHAQYVAGIRNPERRAQRRWAAYPTKVAFWDPDGTSYMTAAFEGFAAQLLWALACHWAISKSYCTQVTQLLFRYMTASFTPQLEEHLVTLYLANALVELQAGGGGRLDALQTNSWTSGASLLASALAEYRQLGDAQEGDRGQCMTRLLHVLLQQGCGLMPDAVHMAQWSRFQQEVQSAVGAVAGSVSFQLARISFDGGVHVPLPVTTVLRRGDDANTAVFANGPACYVHDAQHTRTVVTTVAMRNDMLRMAGWTVVDVDWYAWPSTRREQHEYIAALLDGGA